MKHLLPLSLLLLGPLAVRAQGGLGMTNFGTAVMLGGVSAHHPQSPTEYAAQRSYQGQWYACKRTPPGQLPHKGRKRVAALEQFLDNRQLVMLTHPTGGLVSEAQQADYLALRASVTKVCPMWNLQAYDEELNFYRAEDRRRQGTVEQ